MKTITRILMGSFLLLAATGCIDHISITGNGNPASQERFVSTFNQVKSYGDFRVYITNGEETSVVVRADENLLHYIETYVSGETLVIDIDGFHSVKAVVPMEIHIVTPELRKITQSGAGLFQTDYFESESFEVVLSGSGKVQTAFDTPEAEVTISGSGKIDLSGYAKNARLLISGSGKVDGTDLQVDNCRTITSGSGDMYISVSDYLSARISGSGNVYYEGNPTVETNISGSGNVIHQH